MTQTTPNHANQERFINHWRQYQGIGGFFRYALRFLLVGVMLSPVVLTGLNPKIGQQLHTARLGDLLLPMAFFLAFFALLPALLLAMVLWKNNQKRFMLLTTEQNRYLPFEKRLWAAGETAWRIAIRIMVALVAVSAILSFGLLLAHNAPDYYAYPFEVSVIFLILHALYQLFMEWRAARYDGELSIPMVFKVFLILFFIATLFAWAFVLMHF